MWTSPDLQFMFIQTISVTYPHTTVTPLHTIYTPAPTQAGIDYKEMREAGKARMEDIAKAFWESKKRVRVSTTVEVGRMEAGRGLRGVRKSGA